MNYYGIFDSSWVLEIFLFVPRPRHDKKNSLSQLRHFKFKGSIFTGTCTNITGFGRRTSVWY